MVNNGISIKEVADFLGHKSLSSTVIYTKANLSMLSEVALPWPEGGDKI
jgi:site-specific recombinase XerD